MIFRKKYQYLLLKIKRTMTQFAIAEEAMSDFLFTNTFIWIYVKKLNSLKLPDH